MRILFALLVTELVPLMASAQPTAIPTYSRSLSDTLRYHEITSVRGVVSTPGGDLPVEVNHDANIAVVFKPNDRAEAWYETLQVSSRSPMGNKTPDATELLHEPFVLEFGANGDVNTVSAPAIPESFVGVTNLRSQFMDFFLVLPDEPLRPGAEWESTIRKQDSTDTGGTVNFEKVGTYKVVGDTLIDGAVAVLIEAAVQNTIESTQFIPAQGITVRSVFKGPEQNRFYFSTDRGELILRKRSAHIRGTSEVTGGPQPMSMDQEMQYESSLNLEQ
jgi:hypothetical protein